MRLWVPAPLATPSPYPSPFPLPTPSHSLSLPLAIPYPYPSPFPLPTPCHSLSRHCPTTSQGTRNHTAALALCPHHPDLCVQRSQIGIQDRGDGVGAGVGLQQGQYVLACEGLLTGGVGQLQGPAGCRILRVPPQFPHSVGRSGCGGGNHCHTKPYPTVCGFQPNWWTGLK